MYPEAPKRDKWLVYLIGCAVFIGILCFGLTRFFDLSAPVSLAIAIPGGVVAFFLYAMIAENFESGGWSTG